MKGRHAGQAPEIDGQVFLSGGEVHAGQMVSVEITQASDYDLVGEVLEGEAAAVAPPPKKARKVALPVLGTSGTRSWQ
jgi:ribosomal protein S12 methylthiotransferase